MVSVLAWKGDSSNVTLEMVTSKAMASTSHDSNSHSSVSASRNMVIASSVSCAARNQFGPA